MFSDPCGFALDNQGNIVVSDEERFNIRVFTPQGELIQTIDKNSGAPLKSPVGVGVDVHGNFIVTDRDINYIINPQGKIVLQFGNHRGKSSSHWGVKVDKNGIILVADQGRDVIWMYSSQGGEICCIGKEDIGEEGGLSDPFNVTIDQNGRILTVDRGNSRIMIYE